VRNRCSFHIGSFHQSGSLCIANKQDLSNATSTHELANALQLSNADQRTWHIQPCCATDSEGLLEGMPRLALERALQNGLNLVLTYGKRLQQFERTSCCTGGKGYRCSRNKLDRTKSSRSQEGQPATTSKPFPEAPTSPFAHPHNQNTLKFTKRWCSSPSGKDSSS